MRATKKQITVIVLLNIVIAALVLAFLYYKTPLFRSSASAGNAPVTDGDNSDNTDAPPQQVVHNKLRDASPGKVKEIAFEARLMGSGDESIVFSHTSGGVCYIFGNAAVSDYDFDSVGGFLCRVDGNGKIVGFTYFDGKLTAVGVTEGGFAAAASVGGDSPACKLYGVSDDGKIELLTDLEGTALDIIAVGSKKMAVITAIGEGTVKLTEFTRAGSGWAVGKSTRISSGLSVQYFDCYVLDDKYIISARAYSSPRYDAIVFYTLQAGGDAVPHYYGGNDESMLRPYAVLPYDNGYMAVCEKDGEAAIVTLDYGFSSYRRDMLKIKCTDAELLYSGGKYYACFVTPDGAVTYEVDKLLNRKTVTAVNGKKLTAVVNMDSPLFVCQTENAVTFTDGQVSATLEIAGAEINRVFKMGYNHMLVALTSRGGSALSAPIGGADAYVISVKL